MTERVLCRSGFVFAGRRYCAGDLVDEGDAESYAINNGYGMTVKANAPPVVVPEVAEPEALGDEELEQSSELDEDPPDFHKADEDGES